jgi:hypothetical protein
MMASFTLREWRPRRSSSCRRPAEAPTEIVDRAARKITEIRKPVVPLIEAVMLAFSTNDKYGQQ